MTDHRTDWLSFSTEIPNRVDFARFLIALAEDLRKNPETWERVDLESYLRAMAHWAMNSMEAVYRNFYKSDVPNPPTWRAFANILVAGRAIED